MKVVLLVSLKVEKMVAWRDQMLVVWKVGCLVAQKVVQKVDKMAVTRVASDSTMVAQWDSLKVVTMVDPLVPPTVVMTVASLGLQLVVLKVGLTVGQKVALLV